MVKLPLRPCVVGVFAGQDGLLLVGERADIAGVHQFPQGGINPGETPRDAIRREIEEEMGIREFEIVREHSEWLSYEFPSNSDLKIAKSFRGQIQKWFLLALRDGHPPNLDAAIDREFQRCLWMKPSDVLAGVVSWKRETYRLGLAALLDGIVD